MMQASSHDPSRTPGAEVSIDEELIRGLLADQHPDLARESLEAVGGGWDNALWRLGTELAVRLPRRALAAPLILHEQRWLPELMDGALENVKAIAIPRPLRVGHPSAEFPWHWSVVPWLPGTHSSAHGLREGDAQALAQFLDCLHQPAPAEAPANPFRGIPLSDRREGFRQRLDRAVELERLPTGESNTHPSSAGSARSPTQSTSAEILWSAFEEAAALTRSDDRSNSEDATPVWVHGDLHSKNVLVHRGRLSAIIDWGDLHGGDPAPDLAAMWLLLPENSHSAFWSSYRPISESLRLRARAWAIVLATTQVILTDDPHFAQAGVLALERILKSLNAWKPR